MFKAFIIVIFAGPMGPQSGFIDGNKLFKSQDACKAYLSRSGHIVRAAVKRNNRNRQVLSHSAGCRRYNGGNPT